MELFGQKNNIKRKKNIVRFKNVFFRSQKKWGRLVRKNENKKYWNTIM